MGEGRVHGPGTHQSGATWSEDRRGSDAKCWRIRLVNEITGGERKTNCLDERCNERVGFGQL
jgi:hypothetical protein